MARQPTGWIRNDSAVEDVIRSLGSGVYGQNVQVDGEPLAGYASRQIGRGNHGVFTHLSGLSFGPKFRPAYRQTRGVCVGCATARAIEDSWLHAISQKAVYGRPVRVDVASIYAGARTEPNLGNGRLGQEDGCVVAWAAKWVHDWGAVEQDQIGPFDLTGLNEKLAVFWGRPGSGVPKEVKQRASGIRIRCFYCRSGQNMLDAAYAGFALAFGWKYTFGDKNASGISRLNRPASHATELLGACVTPKGDPLIGGQQSWGQTLPKGPTILKYRDGEVQMRPGMCFVPMEDFDKALRSGAECWAFQVEKGWR